MKALEILFTVSCPNLLEVARLRQKLMLIYRQNNGYLSAATITGLVWDIVTNSAQFF